MTTEGSPRKSSWSRGLRLWVAVAVGRLVALLSRATGHGGSSLPGLWARRVDPDVLRRLAGSLPDGVVVVTGTNGKTTTAALLRHMLQRYGWPSVANSTGANMVMGLITALLGGVDGRLRPTARLAILEIDEATLPAVAASVRPRVLVATNVFRDQLDRYGELSTTVGFIGRALAQLAGDGHAVLNADDPYVASLGGDGARVLWYGMNWRPSTDSGRPDDVGDARFCPRCAGELLYTVRYYAHLGHYHCPACGFARPSPTVAVEAVVTSEDGTATVLVGIGPLRQWVTVGLPGTYNLYNALAAMAAASVLGVTLETASAALTSASPSFGRMERLTWHDRTVHLILVKNPTGFNQVLEAISRELARTGGDILVCLSDRYADGRDVSWIWDVDCERWARAMPAARWWLSGSRADDMALRLKYAGVEAARLGRLSDDPGDALATLVGQGGEGPIYVLPTYTALLAVRRRLGQEGLVRHFREG